MCYFLAYIIFFHYISFSSFLQRVAQAKLPCLELISVESPSLPACALSILLDTAAFPALNEIRYYTFDDMDAELETLVDLFKKRNARLDIEHG